MRLGSAVGPYSRRAGWLRYPLPCCLRRPRSAAFTSILLYPTDGALKCAEPSVGATGWPRPWSCWWRCAAAQKNPSVGVRQNELGPMESRRGRAGCSQGKVPQGQVKMEGGKGTSWGCEGDVFRCEDRAVERLLRGVGCVWVSLLRYRYLGFVVF